MMKTNLRGELALYKDEEMHQFCVRDNELIDAVASHFKVGSTEVRKHMQFKKYIASDAGVLGARHGIHSSPEERVTPGRDEPKECLRWFFYKLR